MPEVRPFDDNFVEMVPRMQLVNRQKKLVEKENQIQVKLPTLFPYIAIASACLYICAVLYFVCVCF